MCYTGSGTRYGLRSKSIRLSMMYGMQLQYRGTSSSCKWGYISCVFTWGFEPCANVRSAAVLCFILNFFRYKNRSLFAQMLHIAHVSSPSLHLVAMHDVCMLAPHHVLLCVVLCVVISFLVTNSGILVEGPQPCYARLACACIRHASSSFSCLLGPN